MRVIEYAIKQKLDETIISFLKFRPNLLHKIDKISAWPSPSWDIASKLLSAGLDIDPVMDPHDTEHRSFGKVYKTLPSIDPILSANQTNSQSIFQQDMHSHLHLYLEQNHQAIFKMH